MAYMKNLHNSGNQPQVSKEVFTGQSAHRETEKVEVSGCGSLPSPQMLYWSYTMRYSR